MAVSILHIGYFPALLQTRQMMLQRDGYDVVSALGNDQAVTLAGSARFDLVVVGFSAAYALRAQIVRWLKQHVPDIPVLVLLAHERESFPEADCATLSEDPRVWLAAVGDCVKKS